jgi:uncharacterized membrane protein
MTENVNSRLEAFCDAVFAIALTLLIIDVKLPAAVQVDTTSDLWLAIGHTLPSIFAFLLSFGIILITWVNHHAAMRLVGKCKPAFIYANGFLLLAIVVLPFPTTILAEHIFTSHAAPAVVLYSLANWLQSIGWILLTQSSLKGVPLVKNQEAALIMRDLRKKSFFAFCTYTVTTIIAFWYPLAIAVVITLIWIAWLLLGLTLKNKAGEVV